MNNTLKLLDLFSGIGGFSLGFERTNRIKTIAFCEKDKFCQTVLKKHWKDIKIYDDIRNINGSEIKADIITGGFPCQPFSVAGKRRGKDDDRYLWDETIRVVAETKPRWFVGENVDGIINIANGSILQQIQKDLEKENFQVQSLVIPASGVGAWHQRKRVWIIANSISKLSNGCSGSSRNSTKEQQRLDSDKKRNRNKIWSKAERCSKQIQSWWQTQSKLCGVPDGVSTELHKDRQNRIKALGNSIVPEIAYLIANSIIFAEDEQQRQKETTRITKQV